MRNVFAPQQPLEDQNEFPFMDHIQASQAVEPVLNPIPWLEENDPRLQNDIVNLSGALLTNDQISALKLGLNF